MSDTRDRPTDGDRSGRASRGRADGSEFQRAVGRLEEAVEELVASARDQLSESAIQIIEETTERLRGRRVDRADGYQTPVDPESDGGDTDAGTRGRAVRQPRASRADRWARKQDRWTRRQQRWAERQTRRHARWEQRWDSWWGGGRPRLTRNRRDVWIGGVCSGLARHFEMEAWVVRLIAVSLLLFTPMTALVFCAYIAAWIFLPDGPAERAEDVVGGGRRRADADRPGGPDPDRHRASVAPELGPRLSPRRSLREVRAQFDTVELKLRRMESFVTSPRFELERELTRMEAR